MFLHTCSACDRRQLIFPSQVTAVASSDRGPLATFTCWCGAEQSAPLNLVPRESEDPVQRRQVELVA